MKWGALVIAALIMPCGCAQRDSVPGEATKIYSLSDAGLMAIGEKLDFDVEALGLGHYVCRMADRRFDVRLHALPPPPAGHHKSGPWVGSVWITYGDSATVDELWLGRGLDMAEVEQWFRDRLTDAAGK